MNRHAAFFVIQAIAYPLIQVVIENDHGFFVLGQFTDRAFKEYLIRSGAGRLW